MVSGTESRVSVMTGGGSGTGRAVTLRLAEADDRVCLCGLNERGLTETANLVRSSSSLAETAIIEVRDRSAVETWCADVIARFGKIDCLFSNAGVNARAFIAEMAVAS